MDLLVQAMFIIGFAWACLVGYLVFGMFRQRYTQANVSRQCRQALECANAKNTTPDAKAGAPKKA